MISFGHSNHIPFVISNANSNKYKNSHIHSARDMRSSTHIHSHSHTHSHSHSNSCTPPISAVSVTSRCPFSVPMVLIPTTANSATPVTANINASCCHYHHYAPNSSSPCSNSSSKYHTPLRANTNLQNMRYRNSNFQLYSRAPAYPQRYQPYPPSVYYHHHHHQQQHKENMLNTILTTHGATNTNINIPRSSPPNSELSLEMTSKQQQQLQHAASSMVIDLGSDDIDSPSNHDKVSSNSNTTVPSSTMSATGREYGASSLTPIDLTRSNSNSYQNSMQNSISHSNASSNSNSNSSSPIISTKQHVINSNPNQTNNLNESTDMLSLTSISELSTDRKRRLFNKQAPQTQSASKRRKIDTNNTNNNNHAMLSNGNGTHHHSHRNGNAFGALFNHSSMNSNTAANNSNNNMSSSNHVNGNNGSNNINGSLNLCNLLSNGHHSNVTNNASQPSVSNNPLFELQQKLLLRKLSQSQATIPNHPNQAQQIIANLMHRTAHNPQQNNTSNTHTNHTYTIPRLVPSATAAADKIVPQPPQQASSTNAGMLQLLNKLKQNQKKQQAQQSPTALLEILNAQNALNHSNQASNGNNPRLFNVANASHPALAQLLAHISHGSLADHKSFKNTAIHSLLTTNNHSSNNNNNNGMVMNNGTNNQNHSQPAMPPTNQPAMVSSNNSPNKNEPIIILSDDDSDIADHTNTSSNHQLHQQHVETEEAQHDSNHDNNSKSNTSFKSKKIKRRNNKRYTRQQLVTNSELPPNFESTHQSQTKKKKVAAKRGRKRRRSPSSTVSTTSTSVEQNEPILGEHPVHDDDDINVSDRSYKQEFESIAVASRRRPRQKRACNIDKEWDEEERAIADAESMCIKPVSTNPCVVAYAEELHLDDMKLSKEEYFPILRQMPRSALVKYCDYYKLRYSKRSKDNRLLQIVTKHFIIHNRQKYRFQSTQEMENDLFWHSVCHRYNNNNNQQQVQSPKQEQEEHSQA